LEENGMGPLEAFEAARNMVAHREIIVGEGMSKPVPADGHWRLVEIVPSHADREVQGRRESSLSFRPPRWVEKMLYLVLRKHDREEALGDLYEEYPDVVAKFGASFARKWAVI